jgi:DNA-binding MarR family transcriptional regulator
MKYDRRPGKKAQATPDQGGALLFGLIELGAQLHQQIEDALEKVGISLAKQGVLRTLAEAGAPLPLSELAARQKCVRSNITQLVDRLEADGLVRREPDPDDRRSIRAVLTTEGAARQEAGEREVERVRESFMNSMRSSDRAALERILKSLG